MRRYFSDVESWLGLPWERFLALGSASDDRDGFNMTHLAVAASRPRQRREPHPPRGVAPAAAAVLAGPAARRGAGPSRHQRRPPRDLDLARGRRAARPGLGVATAAPTSRARRGARRRRAVGGALRRQAAAGRVAARGASRAPAKSAASRRRSAGARSRPRRERAADRLRAALRALQARASCCSATGAAWSRCCRDRDRPVRILFAGKAHPRDGHGQEILKRGRRGAPQRRALRARCSSSRTTTSSSRASLVQGVDVWLNTPMRRLEASGTSGMKAAANGGLNLSVARRLVDRGRSTARTAGRSPAALWPRIRWAIDNLDAADVLRLIDLEIAPLFFDRGDDGVPSRWLERSVRSMRLVAERFSARRMVEEYRDWAYVPSARSWFLLRERDFAAARDAVGSKRRLRRGWKQIQVLGVELPETGTLELGERLEAIVDLDLGDLTPGGRARRAGGRATVAQRPARGRERGRRWLPTTDRRPARAARRIARFRAEARLEHAGRWACGVRLRPNEGDEPSPGLADLVLWV